MIPPWLLVIKIDGKRRLNLYLPLVLLWPLFAILWVLAAAFWLIQTDRQRGHTSRSYQILAVLQAVGALRGLLVKVHSVKEDVMIEFV
jgi:hypothetical protein|tara:strand:+ start:3763 stop:4026 length:264 start_codon:yes stop_codon:yes gene_type:complete